MHGVSRRGTGEGASKTMDQILRVLEKELDARVALC